MNTPVTPVEPEKVPPPITTPPPLEPEQPPIEVRDSHYAHVVSHDVDKSAGDEGIDDAQADDTEIKEAEIKEPPPPNGDEEELGEE